MIPGVNPARLQQWRFRRAPPHTFGLRVVDGLLHQRRTRLLSQASFQQPCWAGGGGLMLWGRVWAQLGPTGVISLDVAIVGPQATFSLKECLKKTETASKCLNNSPKTIIFFTELIQ